MSKYIKLEDAIGMFSRSGEYHADAIVDMLFYLPTIEVSEEQLSKLKSSENSVENTTVSEDFTSISRAKSKLEVSEDCISKAYLEQEIENLCRTVDKDKEYWRGWNNALDKVVELIEDAPSVVPSRAEDEWKWESGDVCDNCGYEIPHLERMVGDVVLMDSKDWNYCPNCGAKMRGADND